jgi:hypothetical protein
VAGEAKSHNGVRVAPITMIDGEPLRCTFAAQLPHLDRLLTAHHLDTY